LVPADLPKEQTYLKASNTRTLALFGYSLALEGDTLVVGSVKEASSATGVDGDQTSTSAPNAGAVYVFTRSAGVWSQNAYIKASNTAADSLFAYSVALSGDTVAVGARHEPSNATGIDGDQTNTSAPLAGAAYVFR
jgi:trimeric autotransporter adhesin